jgi:pimeloyl-ACP methyl ester carboxylesterase
MSTSRWMGVGLMAFVLLAGGAYVHARSGLLPLDDDARSRAPGNFVELSDGRVHYAWHGPAGGSVTVLVHGFSTPSFVWAGLIEPFVRANMRVLTYDNFGRGFSDRPDTHYDAALFDRQLVELLASQGIDQPIDLVGYSMGGAIGIYFAAHHPEKVRMLGLIAPAGFPVNLGFAAQLLRLPGLGDWLMAVVGKRTMLSTMARPENQGRAIPDIVERYEVQMAYEGYLRSLLSTMRHFPLDAMEVEFERVGAAAIPLLAVWGDRDSIVPLANAERIASAVPQAQIEVVAGGTHAITYSEPERVSAALIRFFGAPRAPPGQGRDS